MKNKNSEFPTALNEDESTWWWNPSQDSLPVQFSKDTTIHGLPFIGRLNIHLFERIFWAIAFLLGVAGATYLIYNVWSSYYKNPVIVSFQPELVDIDSIPFPAVTICNINAFPLSMVKQIHSQAKQPGKDGLLARSQIKYIETACHTRLTFAEEFNYAFTRGGEEGETSDNGADEEGPAEFRRGFIEFLFNYTIPCEEMIRLCKWGEEQVDCKEIFKPAIMDIGKCCSFNSLPTGLLLKFQRVARVHRRLFRWNDTEMSWWKAWDYEEGFQILNKSSKMPYRQTRAGVPYGLSILLDPKLEDMYCTVNDAIGFRILLHNPLDRPHMSEFASMIDTNQEIFVEVHPDMTKADDAIKKFDKDKRNCNFPNESKLNFFQPYTRDNCMDECKAFLLRSECDCTYFYMPRLKDNETIHMCNPDEGSRDHDCIKEVKNKLLANVKTICGHCVNLCDTIVYNAEYTMAGLQEGFKLWGDPDAKQHKNGSPGWANNSMSVVHIFMGAEQIVPKLRTVLYGTTDLIASTGGLLGLCLGVSVLSIVEFIYFLTMRLFWKCILGRLAGKKERSFLHVRGKQPIRKPASQVVMELENKVSVLGHIHPNHYFRAFYNDIYENQ